jgi:hypothetical protein
VKLTLRLNLQKKMRGKKKKEHRLISQENIGTLIAEWKQERAGRYQFLAASSPMHNNTRQKAPVPLSYVGTRAADRRPLAPIIAAKLEILVRPKGPHWLTLFRPAVRHDPPN